MFSPIRIFKRKPKSWFPWKQIQVSLSLSTSPEVITFSAKYSGLMPCYWKCAKLSPHSLSLLIDFSTCLSESMSQSKLNCHVETGEGILPFSSESVMPNYIIFSWSILDLILLYYLWSSGPLSKSLSSVPGNSVSMAIKGNSSRSVMMRANSTSKL